MTKQITISRGSTQYPPGVYLGPKRAKHLEGRTTGDRRAKTHVA